MSSSGQMTDQPRQRGYLLWPSDVLFSSISTRANQMVVALEHEKSKFNPDRG
jgi:hypothetical protein